MFQKGGLSWCCTLEWHKSTTPSDDDDLGHEKSSPGAPIHGGVNYISRILCCRYTMSQKYPAIHYPWVSSSRMVILVHAVLFIRADRYTTARFWYKLSCSASFRHLPLVFQFPRCHQNRHIFNATEACSHDSSLYLRNSMASHTVIFTEKCLDKETIPYHGLFRPFLLFW